MMRNDRERERTDHDRTDEPEQPPSVMGSGDEPHRSVMGGSDTSVPSVMGTGDRPARRRRRS